MAMSLAHEIIYGTKERVAQLIATGVDVNEIDDYGFTPLIEAAIVNSVEITALLLEHGADISQPDVTGRTPLHWAIDNNNLPLSKLLLDRKADPNAYTFGGQPVLVYPLLRNQQELKKLLYQYGADLNFAQDFINSKLLAHRYQLFGQVDIVAADGRFVELDFEGFFLEFTLGIIQHSLERYRNNFAARRFRAYFNHLSTVIEKFATATALLKYQRYTIKIEDYAHEIDALLNNDLLLLPVAYQGHAITFIKYHDIWVRCDRGAQSKVDGTVAVFRITKPQRLNKEFIKFLLYKPQSEHFVNEEIKDLLGLVPIIQLPLEAQITGNCSWANVEAGIPALMFLLSLKKQNTNRDLARYSKAALTFYRQWLEWDKDRALEESVQSFAYASRARKASKAAMLGAVLFQQCNYHSDKDMLRAEKLLSILTIPEYSYVLKSYVQVYWKKRNTEAGKNLVQLLDLCGVKI